MPRRTNEPKNVGLRRILFTFAAAAVQAFVMSAGSWFGAITSGGLTVGSGVTGCGSGDTNGGTSFGSRGET
jgi:hypothetical protein